MGRLRRRTVRKFDRADCRFHRAIRNARRLFRGQLERLVVNTLSGLKNFNLGTLSAFRDVKHELNHIEHKLDRLLRR